MASLPNGLKTLLKNFNSLNVTDRQKDDKQTDRRQHTANVNMSLGLLKNYRSYTLPYLQHFNSVSHFSVAHVLLATHMFLHSLRDVANDQERTTDQTNLHFLRSQLIWSTLLQIHSCKIMTRIDIVFTDSKHFFPVNTGMCSQNICHACLAIAIAVTAKSLQIPACHPGDRTYLIFLAMPYHQVPE